MPTPRHISLPAFPFQRHQPEFTNRADLRQNPEPNATRHDALVTIYFNSLLLEQFQKGNTPQKGKEEQALETEAEKLAKMHR